MHTYIQLFILIFSYWLIFKAEIERLRSELSESSEAGNIEHETHVSDKVQLKESVEPSLQQYETTEEEMPELELQSQVLKENNS